MEFSDKVVLITGASSGIGAATAKKFAELSANLSLVGRNTENLNKVAQECEKSGVKVLSITADISVDKDVERIIKETIDTFGKLDILVNNAGIVMCAGILDGIASYDTIMATNTRGPYLLTSLAAPHIIKTKGNIVNVSSIAAVKPFDDKLAYNMSKAALDMFTKVVALELAPRGVRVNSVNPGGTITNIARNLTFTKEQMESGFRGEMEKVPLKRLSESEEMADMIVYIAGHKALGMTGSIVTIDNGSLLT